MSGGTSDAAKLVDVFLVTFALILMDFSYATPVVNLLLMRAIASNS